MPLYKGKGDANLCDNYRGITLLSCIGKLFTACLNCRITNYLDRTGVLGDEQAGFRSGFSTIDHAFTLNCIIDIYLQRKKRLFCAFINYKKTFDLVDRSSLWCKLLANGINGKIITIICNLYLGAKSSVKYNGRVSEYFTCNVGVRQGENLSPLLFALYLNDFEYAISRKYSRLNTLANDIRSQLSDDDFAVFNGLYTLLYADDTIVLAESINELQVARNAVREYCNKWSLTVNTSKTKIAFFSRGRVRNLPELYFGNDLLDFVDEYTYLSIIFNCNSVQKSSG